MILRVVRGRVRSDRLQSLDEPFAARFAERARAVPGLLRFHVAVRPDGDAHELVVVTFWASVEAALDAYDGDLDAVRTLDGVGQDAELLRVEYFEVDESQLRRSTAEAAVLRLTVGRVSRGLDVSIQEELRARLRELSDDDLEEAYVGRRIVGDDVEVAFVSAWRRVPPGRSLDQPIWPDISDRYDAFSVATYLPIVSGAATV